MCLNVKSILCESTADNQKFNFLTSMLHSVNDVPCSVLPTSHKHTLQSSAPLQTNVSCVTVKIRLQYAHFYNTHPQTLTGNLWENVILAVQYAPDLRHSILYFFFKPRSTYNNRSALTPERTDEPTYLLVLDEWT